MNKRTVDKLLEKAYLKYCNGEDHCYFITCPINSLMLNMSFHVYQKDELMIYGDYKILERLAK